MVFLAISVMGLAYMAFCTQEARLSFKHLRQKRAYFIAQAGIEYAHSKLEDDWSWNGVTKDFGGGTYIVSVTGTSTKNVTSEGRILSEDGSSVLASHTIEVTIQQ